MTNKIENKLVNRHSGLVEDIEFVNEQIKTFSRKLCPDQGKSSAKIINEYIRDTGLTTLPVTDEFMELVSRKTGIAPDIVKVNLGWDSLDGRKTMISAKRCKDHEYKMIIRRTARKTGEYIGQKKSKSITVEEFDTYRSDVIDALKKQILGAEITPTDIKGQGIDIKVTDLRTGNQFGIILTMKGRTSKTLGNTTSGCDTLEFSRSAEIERVMLIAKADKITMFNPGSVTMLLKNDAEIAAFDGQGIFVAAMTENDEFQEKRTPYTKIKDIDFNSVFRAKTTAITTDKGESADNIITRFTPKR